MSRIVSFFACLLLAGCAAAPLSPSTVAAYGHNVELSGRLQVNYQKDGKSESVSGKFSWQQAGSRIDVTLASPLGTTLARITVTPQAATLVQSDQAPRTAPDVDRLTNDVLGWSLPVSGLRDWLQGHATGADGKPFAASPLNNTVTTADGWKLRFVSWQDENAAHPSPRRIDCERPATLTTEELTIRIVLDAQP